MGLILHWNIVVHNHILKIRSIHGYLALFLSVFVRHPHSSVAREQSRTQVHRLFFGSTWYEIERGCWYVNPETFGTIFSWKSILITWFHWSSQVNILSLVQSSPVRNVEGISRPTQHGKAVSVSRRTLPPILPKTIPPKALVSSPGRKLASILPAPAKSTSSSLPNPLIVPVVVSSGSSPIPIAPSPRPPQPYTPGLTSSVMNKVTTVSMITGQSSDLKRYDREFFLHKHWWFLILKAEWHVHFS